MGYFSEASSVKHVRDVAFVAVAPAVAFAFAVAVAAVMALELLRLPRTTGKTSRQQYDLFVQTSQLSKHHLFDISLLCAGFLVLS